jgi:hypothetical protein
VRLEPEPERAPRFCGGQRPRGSGRGAESQARAGLTENHPDDLAPIG